MPLFKITENIKAIKNVKNVMWTEEVSPIRANELPVLGLKQSREDSPQNIDISVGEGNSPRRK